MKFTIPISKTSTIVTGTGKKLNRQIGIFLISYIFPRWGPGLVIYWLGFTEDIVNSPEKRFVIMNEFPTPERITHMDCGVPDRAIIEKMKKLSCESYGNTEDTWD